jgi:hypothetical protein
MRMKIPANKTAAALVAGFLVGTLWVVAVRFITYKSENVHYHANFALYVNGKRDEFKSFTFYEEVAACATDVHDNPKSRVHMHAQNGGLVHVHAHGVTWGHLFANFGYTLGDAVLKTDEGVFAESGENKLRFWLNGQETSTIANKLISSEDKLLINFGDESDAVLQQRAQQIPTDAKEYNGKYDPGGCSGGEELTLFERLQKSFP